jgi:hypothetical protein
MPGVRTEAVRRGEELLDRTYKRTGKELGLLTTIKHCNLLLLSLAFRRGCSMKFASSSISQYSRVKSALGDTHCGLAGQAHTFGASQVADYEYGKLLGLETGDLESAR